MGRQRDRTQAKVTSTFQTRRNSRAAILARLEARIQEEAPARGSLPYPKNSIVAFGSLPISPETLRGLTVPKNPSKSEQAYTTLTEIQARSLPHSLAGRDILGAAKTGSGKTLAFLIPLLERLYRNSWTQDDGVGAIVLSPTRELAGQIYAVLQTIGRFHTQLNLGLLIGGGNPKRQNQIMATQFQQEQMAIPTTNILICTPGRLLQHLEQTPYMNIDNLQMLVLDEADRILDMGFRKTLVKILDYLQMTNETRQTLLFSATQTKTVQDLAVLSINRKNVEYIGVTSPKEKNNEKDDNDDDDDNEKGERKNSTPDRLKQAYVIVPLQHKLNCVFSFLKSHLRHKTIVFLNSCSQVRYVWDLFCRLRPGLSVLALHGKLSQTKRLGVYDKFSTTPHCVLFATDVAARGLDFPNVDWVLQVDAPEDKDMYVHRVGRTARFKAKGQALMLLDPLEEKTIQQWGLSNLKKKSINPTKTMLVSQRSASLVAEHVSLHALAKKAFLSYVRSLTLLPKSTWGMDGWDVQKFDWDAFALSLGLATMPSLDMIFRSIETKSREGLRETKNINRKLQKLKEQIRLEKEQKKLQKQSKKRKKSADEDAKQEQDDENENDLLVLKARHESIAGSGTDRSDSEPLERVAQPSARHSKKIRIDGGGGGGVTDEKSNLNQHMVFDDEGEAFEKPKLWSNSNDSEALKDQNLKQANESYMQRVRQRLEGTRELDKQEERDRIRAKHKKKKTQERLDADQEESDENDGGGADVAAILDPAASYHGHSVSLNNADGRDSSDSGSSSDSDSGSDSDSSSSSEDDDDSEGAGVAAQEDIALSLIRGRA